MGLSGGVDSSVAAYLLKKQGYDVFGIFMKNWEDVDGSCTAEKDFEDVLAVAEMLEIPCYSVNFTKEYKERVFSHFLKELKAGRTPNPDILCNREIKFDVFFKKAKSLGASYVATGHYAQSQDGKLLTAADGNKDQTYFLHAIDGSLLPSILFPLGNLTKPEVRALAKKADIPVHQKKDSTGICFIGERNFTHFLRDYLPYSPGRILTVEGVDVGQHIGIAYYTIGQRKGLGIGGPGEAYFVVEKDAEKNVLYVAQGETHPALYAEKLIAHSPTWLHTPPSFPHACHAKIRYRQPSQACTIYEENGKLSVIFKEKQRAITPSQSIVFYDGIECIGGAVIENAQSTASLCSPLPTQEALL